jgi:Chaperone of endosialidase
MARYNTVYISGSVSTGTTLNTPSQGVFTEFTGTAPYTVQLPNPSLYSGSSQVFYNATSGTVTLSTSATSGNIVGPGTGGTTTQAMTTNTALMLYSDGTNWVATTAGGGALSASTLTASSTVTLSPSSSSVTISPGGGLTIAPSGTSGTINNVIIGGTTPLAGSFTTLSASLSVSLTPSGSLSIAPSGSTGTINNVSIGQSTAAAGSFTNLSSSGTVSGSGFSTYLASPPAIGGTAAAAGTFTTLSATSITETSSIAFKTNVSPITNALESVLSLVGVTYDRKDGSRKNEAGLIAEEVYKHLPNLVTTDDKGNPAGIHYSKLTAYLVESIKSLKEEIDQLKGKK